MEKLLSIKEKIKNVNSLISNLQNDNICLIEKDIILAELRGIYNMINSIEIDDFSVISDVKEKVIIDNGCIKDVDEINVEKTNLHILEKDDSEVEQITTESDINDSEKSEISNPVHENAMNMLTESDKNIETPKQQKLFDNVPKNDNLNNGGGNVKTVGEKLGQNKKSLNERLAEKSNPNDIASKISQKPISDIKSAIGIGDRFLYIRELFDGNNDLFEQTVSHLNSLNSYNEANDYLKDNFKWESTEETAVGFLNVVRRKYL